MKKVFIFIITTIIMVNLVGCGKSEVPDINAIREYNNNNESREVEKIEPCKNGHTPTEVTCTEPSKCSECGILIEKPTGHDFIDATCMNAKTCQLCGFTVGNVIDHNISNFEVITESTCSDFGVSAGECSMCHSIFEQQIPKINHTYIDYEIITDATFNEPGERVYTCTVCGKVSETEYFYLTDEEKIAWIKKNCESFGTYADVKRNSDDYYAKYVKVNVKCYQVFYEDSSQQHILGNSSYYDDPVCMVYFRDICDFRVIDGDYITAYGQYAGEYTYEGTDGREYTVPLIYVYYCEQK